MSSRAARRAFTLVEVLISVVILGCGLVVILQSYLAALNAAETSRNYLLACRFAQRTFDDLEIEAYKLGGLLPRNTSGNFSLDGRMFNWSSVVTGVDNPQYLAQDTVAAEVTLEWRQRSRPMRVALAGFLARGKAPSNNTTEE